MFDWIREGLGADLAFWVQYLTNGKHLAWYASFQFNIIAAVLGGILALLFGLGGAALKNSRFAVPRVIGSTYAAIVRGVPDVLFFLFFPLAFEQTIEWFRAQAVCGAGEVASTTWPPCQDANLFFGQTEYLLLACLSLGIVYGAFVTNVIHGAMKAVPRGQLEAARAFGFSPMQVLWRVHVRQMWIYAIPGLSNVWMLLVKATALLSLLQIADIVLWADRLGAPNFIPAVGLVHDDWRWRYYLVLFLFYILVTFLSEKFFAALSRRAGRGMIAEAR